MMNNLNDYPEEDTGDGTKITIPMQDLIIIFERAGVKAAVGEPKRFAFPGGPCYVSYTNGVEKPEGTAGLFCGDDVSLVRVFNYTLDEIIYRAQQDKVGIYIRCDMSVCRYKASIGRDKFGGRTEYRPANIECSIRVAFDPEFKDE